MIAVHEIAAGLFHAARAASKEKTNFIIRTVALMNTDFLSLPLRKEHQLSRDCHARCLFQQRPDASAKGTARHVRTAEGIFDDRIIGAADFE